ncbi:hypothetical protein [Streptomyces sp. NPDC007088]|uniref:hypothetical protein n=1 Tax=Streptomyces sp. NPDC007088 TaxID=3364773 RepID=UPI0036C64011
MSKHLGVDPRWAVRGTDPATLARHDGRMLMTSGWVSRVLQETVALPLVDEAVGRRVREVGQTYTERRSALVGALERPTGAAG